MVTMSLLKNDLVLKSKVFWSQADLSMLVYFSLTKTGYGDLTLQTGF